MEKAEKVGAAKSHQWLKYRMTDRWLKLKKILFPNFHFSILRQTFAFLESTCGHFFSASEKTQPLIDRKQEGT